VIRVRRTVEPCLRLATICVCACAMLLASSCGLPNASVGPAGRVARVAVLAANCPDQQRWQAFLEGMRDHRWIEGQNLVTEWDIADPPGTYEQLPELASALVRRGVDVIISGETPAVQAARVASATVPIMMTAVGDPVAVHLVESLAYPAVM
jgi:putative tryptophan/tyrosine transport system substrate-binding protein